MKLTLHNLIKKAEDNYVDGTVKLGDYVNWEMHKVIEKISAYLNSTHTSGSADSLGRDKPFFNIVTAAVNIWYRATDLDRKDINILPSKSADVAVAFVASIYLRDWMIRNRFGQFLNQWGRTLAQYGSAVVKLIEKDGDLIPSVIPWSRLIVDAVDFDALPRIEVLYKTPAQLRKMEEYDQEVVEDLIKAQSTRKNLDGSNKDNVSEFIEIYEVHGELELSYLTDKDKDDNKYRQQMHVVSFIGDGTKDADNFTLFRGKEAKDPYMITHLMEEEGRTLSIGAVEDLFDAQWMMNHTMKNLKDTLDLSSKLIFQTSDPKFVGRNVLTAIETGDIMTHARNEPLTQINNTKADVTALLGFGDQWKLLAQEITATPDAMRGVTPPSGTPYSTTALLTGQSNSLFEQMTENKGLHLEDMLRIHIIPHLKKKMSSDTNEITATLEDRDIQKLDAMYVPREAIKRFNQRSADQILAQAENIATGAITPPLEPFNRETEEMGVKESLAPLGNQRFLSPGDISWGKAFKDLEWKLEVAVTNENLDKQAFYTTMASVLQTIASNPMVLQDPNAKLLFNKILSQTGQVSPVELSAQPTQPMQQAEVGKELEALTQKR